MKRTALSLTILSLTCCTSSVVAQHDSSWLDVGYLKLRKEFTQLISIKGADLQKMPFTNLSDAISAWLYGAYTTPGTVQYVVDGNPVADVNAYSIYDVEEVILVQHAAALISTAPGQSEFVLIRTKRGMGPGGVTVAAQTGLVAEDGSRGTRFFHNYYAGAYRNIGKISFGVSANYIRDVLPFPPTNGENVTPTNWQRWRLNGYFDWRPDAHDQVEVTMNYTPQQLNGLINPPGSQLYFFSQKLSGYQHYLTPHLDWRGEWAKGLTNDLQATYLHSRLSTDQLEMVGAGQPDSFGFQGSDDVATSYHLWVRDHFSYVVKAGNWTIVPAINLSYEHIDDEEVERGYQGFGTEAVLNLNTTSYLAATFVEGLGEKTSLFLAVPGVDITYRRAIDIAGGALVNTGMHSLTGNGNQVYPYAGLTVDLLRLKNPEQEGSLKLFGSVVSRTATSYPGYTLEDFSNASFGPAPFVPIPNPVGLTGMPPQPPPNFVPPVFPTYWTWEAGVRYTGAKGRLDISYNFEHRISSGLGIEDWSNGWQNVTYPVWYSSLHHLDIRLKVVDIAGASWRSGLNVTLLRTTINLEGTTENEVVPVGDVAPNPWSWTGGWVNRVQVKDFSAGLDLLYHFNETIGYGVDQTKLNSVATPNVYVGYRFHPGREKVLEVFIDSRDLIRNSSSDVVDPRRYYTIGGKLGL
jgi:hypothetical protein